MSEARDPATNRIDAESGESVKSCAAKAMGQAAAHNGVPKEFRGLAICGNCGKEFAPKPRTGGKFCSRACISPGRSQLDEPKIIQLYAQGFGMKAIAKEVIGRVSARSTIRSALRRNGVELRNCAEGKRTSPVRRGDLSQGNNFAVAAELRNKKEKREKLKATCRAAVESLDLFRFAADKQKELAKARNRERITERANALGFNSEFHMRYQTDPKFRVRDIMKRRFFKIVKGHKISTRMLSLLGCSSDELREWIESQWEDWMTWDNLGPQRSGYWQIDHIIPCSWFDQENQEDLEICWHHINLRPICALENNKRGNRPTHLIETIQGRPDHPMKERMLSWVMSRGL